MARVAFITGASSGIGEGIARRLAGDGWHVALAARRTERLRSVVADIESSGGRALAVTCDVSSRDSVREAVATAVDALGPVDLLFANAGQADRSPAKALDATLVERITRVNYFGTVYAVEAVLPSMLERDRGHIVGVGSLAGFNGLPLSAAYSASKSAQMTFLESLRVDLSDTGVYVTVIAPGYVKTPMTDDHGYDMPFLLELDEAVESIYRAVRSRKRLHAFPMPIATLAWVARVFPRWLYDRIAAGVRR